MDPGPTTSARDVDISALPPETKIGRYEVVSILGQGGFGITYRARDVQLGREVAIKEYLPTLLAYRDASATVQPRSTKVADDFAWGRERFVAEGRTLATLHETPGIVKVFDFLEINGTAYIVMEMLRGETLEVHLRKNGPMGAEPIERILRPLLDGLEQVHATGFLHRDIKPANILLNANGQPTLIDFGASRAAMAGRTTAMTAIFTPGYAAAEQMTSAKQGPWTDIYGLSATLYHAITGAPPPIAFDRMLDDEYKPLGQLQPPGFSAGLLVGLDAGLAMRVSERPQSIAALRPLLGMTAAPEAAATIVMGKGPPSITPHRPVIAPSPAIATALRSWTGLWAALGVVLIALLGGGGYYVYASRGPDPEILRAKVAAEQAEASRKAAEEKIAQLQAEADKRRKAQEEAAERQRQEETQAQARRKLEAETRQKIEAELAEQYRAEDAAKEKARVEEENRRKALEDARKAIESIAGDFDRFGPTLMMIGLKGQAHEVRLQGVDAVDDPALLKLGVNALSAQTRNLRCRQTDRLTDGTPLYRCLVTQLNAAGALADIPDSDRTDLALALVRNGLLLASCDAPRSYADAEDDARSRNLSLWSRVKPPEYKRRCTR
jgi:serine/threonine protein kinase/endonuclease YncB( thermonuclease family)